MNGMIRFNFSCLLALTIVAGCGDDGAADSEGGDPTSDAAVPTSTAETAASPPAANGGSTDIDEGPAVTSTTNRATTNKAPSKPATRSRVAKSTKRSSSNPELDKLFPTATERPAPRAVGSRQKTVNYRDGKIKIQCSVRQFSDDSELNHGPYEEYWPSGQLFKKGNFEEGVPVGEWQVWHDNGEISRKPTYIKGQLEGAYDVFRADKTKKAKQSYRNGLKDGEWRMFNDAGDVAIIVVNYSNDMLHGKRSVFYPTGERRGEEYYKDNVRDGTLTSWYENGQKSQKATFRGGKRHGTLTVWNEDGTKRLETEYQDGAPVEEASEDADSSTIDIDG